MDAVVERRNDETHLAINFLTTEDWERILANPTPALAESLAKLRAFREKPRTRRLHNIIHSIHKLTKKLGQPPTVAELRARIKPETHAELDFDLNALEADGFISKEERKRSLRLTDAGYRRLCTEVLR